MRLQRFHSVRLDSARHVALVEALQEAHARAPFSPVDTRGTVRRVVRTGGRLGLPTSVFRGGLDVRGAEADHVWVSVAGAVVDAAFPLLDPGFVMVLRRYVAGEVSDDDLEDAARDCGLETRVIGAFPEPIGYLGSPVWSERTRRPVTA